jgi:hypothetical protein
MEPRFGHDFSKVRVHTDSKAAESARAVNALAYAVGQDIVFGIGGYAPGTLGGRQILAHELTHTLQQSHFQVRNRSDLQHLRIGTSDDAGEQEATRIASAVTCETAAPSANVQSRYTDGRLQRQLVTPLGAGGGFGGLMERDRRAARNTPPASQRQGVEACDLQLCFLPLEVLLDAGVPPALAYLAAVHTYIRWGSRSAGFTRLAGESIGDARVIHPEPRAGQPHERCVQARLRTVPSPTIGQLTHLTPVGMLRDAISYGSDVIGGLRHCANPTCESAQQRIQHMLTDDRRGLYDLFDENCETWARNVLAAACAEAPLAPLGGVGNIAQQILRETPGGDLYHLARRLLGRTRPTPQPTGGTP